MITPARNQLRYRGDPGAVTWYFHRCYPPPDCFLSSVCSHNFAPPMIVKKNNDGERCLGTSGYEVGDLEDFAGPLPGGMFQDVVTNDSNGGCHYEIL